MARPGAFTALLRTPLYASVLARVPHAAMCTRSVLNYATPRTVDVPRPVLTPKYRFVPVATRDGGLLADPRDGSIPALLSQTPELLAAMHSSAEKPAEASK